MVSYYVQKCLCVTTTWIGKLHGILRIGNRVGPIFQILKSQPLEWSSYSITKNPNSKFWKIGPTLIDNSPLLFPFCFQKLSMWRKWNLILLSKKPNWVLKIHRGALSNSVKGQLTKIANHIWKPSSSRLADYGKNQGHFKGGPPLWVVGY